MRKKKKLPSFFFITAVQIAQLMPHALTMRQVPHEVVFRLAPLLFFFQWTIVQSCVCFFICFILFPLFVKVS